MKKLFTSLFVILFMLSSLSFSQVTETTGDELIDWSEGYVEVLGSGAPPLDMENKAQARLMTERAALAVAYRNMVEAVNKVRVEGETFVENYVVQSDKVSMQVQGFVQGAVIIPNEQTGEQYTYLSDGSIRVKLRVALNGADSLAQIIIPEIIGEPTGAVKKYKKPKSTDITGIVIDATESDVKPAMSPRILNSDGDEVYGTKSATSDFAIKEGIAGYAKGLATIEQNERTGDNPLIIKAIKASGPGLTDLVIDNKDAKRINKLRNINKLFDECRVLIVVS